MAKNIVDQLEKQIITSNQNHELDTWSYEYFFYHRKRYKNDLKLIQQYYKNGTILELASAPFHLTYCLKQLNYPIISVDLNPKRQAIFLKKNNLSVIKCDIETQPLPFHNNTFSLVLFNEIFEHLRIDPIFTIKEIHRVLQKNGILILSTPNLHAFSSYLSFIFFNGINDLYLENKKLHNIGHFGHIRIYATKEITEFLKHIGFKIVDIQYNNYHGKRKLENFFIKMFTKFSETQIIIAKK